jgi:hypothetical protein
MSKIAWYYHRLRAMSGTEMLSHALKKWRQFQDARSLPDWRNVKLDATGAFPVLPKPDVAPPALREALARDAREILAGRWKAFGHLPLQVDDPPKWHKDYLVGIEVPTTHSAFKLNHRELPAGADIKLIWELSRWYQLTRLAMAAYVLGDATAAQKCVEWLEDWVRHNPPYTGWNWTSALEVGMRLIQLTWIDALLNTARLDLPGDPLTPALSPKGAREQANGGFAMRLAELRRAILPAHVHYCWRYRSFGSSANNHLLGELVGLIVATTRWPALAEFGAPPGELFSQGEREILAQFAADGGNLEQALNYQLFSWEFGWQAWNAWQAAGYPVAPRVTERLYEAGAFLVKTQVASEPWDYGDSDGAYVLPCFSDERLGASEWREWLIAPERAKAIDYWNHTPRAQFAAAIKSHAAKGLQPSAAARVIELPAGKPAYAWLHFSGSGHAVCRTGRWTLRWDLSPLGYLRTAAHGHLDALHLSTWLDGQALLIDPGTGAYYADKRLRAWLASRTAHNAPCPAGEEWPRRLGPFLWAEHHERPVLCPADGAAAGQLSASIKWAGQLLSRSVVLSGDFTRLEVIDSGPASPFSVRWQFPPDAKLEHIADRKFRVTRAAFVVEIEVSPDWAEVFCVSKKDPALLRAAASSELAAEFAGTVSPAFRKVEWGPFLKLVARPAGNQPCVFRTTFLASPRS